MKSVTYGPSYYVNLFSSTRTNLVYIDETWQNKIFPEGPKKRNSSQMGVEEDAISKPYVLRFVSFEGGLGRL